MSHSAADHVSVPTVRGDSGVEHVTSGRQLHRPQWRFLTLIGSWTLEKNQADLSDRGLVHLESQHSTGGTPLVPSRLAGALRKT